MDDEQYFRACITCGFQTYFHYRQCHHVFDVCSECWREYDDYEPFVDVEECRQCYLIEDGVNKGIKKMGSTVEIENSFELVLKTVKTKGLRVNTFEGKKVPGHQISVQVDPEDIEKIQKFWDSLNAKKQTPFFGFNGANNMLTIKAKKVTDSIKRTCMPKDGDNIYVDIKFAIGEIYVDGMGQRYPQLKMLGLRKVDGPEDEFVVSENF